MQILNILNIVFQTGENGSQNKTTGLTRLQELVFFFLIVDEDSVTYSVFDLLTGLCLEQPLASPGLLNIRIGFGLIFK